MGVSAMSRDINPSAMSRDSTRRAQQPREVGGTSATARRQRRASNGRAALVAALSTTGEAAGRKRKHNQPLGRPRRRMLRIVHLENEISALDRPYGAVVLPIS